jgi:hypothetical protein
MTYSKRIDIPARQNETVVELETGALVATGCIRDRVPTGVAFRAWARAIDATGKAIDDSQGRAVETAFTHVAAPSIVDTEGADAIARDCLLAVLGESVTRPWAEVLLSSASIRVSMLAAQITGPADASSLL